MIKAAFKLDLKREGSYAMHSIKLHQTILTYSTCNTVKTIPYKRQTASNDSKSIPYKRQTASNDPLNIVLRKLERWNSLQIQHQGTSIIKIS